MSEEVVQGLLVEERIEGLDYILDPLLIIEVVFYLEVFEESEGAVHVVLIMSINAVNKVIKAAACEVLLELDFAVLIIDLSSIFGF